MWRFIEGNERFIGIIDLALLGGIVILQRLLHLGSWVVWPIALVTISVGLLILALSKRQAGEGFLD